MNPNNLIPLVAGTVLVSLLLLFIVFVVILYRKAQLKFELERQEFQRAVLEAEVEMREQTLKEVSRDLHDNFGQIASLIKMNLSMLKPETTKDQKHISESIDLLKTLIEDIRVLSRDLAGRDLIQKGLTAMIIQDLERVKRAGLIKVNILHLPQSSGISPEISVFVYRMFQEILNNILKHSQATEIKLSLYEDETNLSLQLSDNGTGIPRDLLQHKFASSNGNGLQNIRERCRIIGGQVSIESSPDTGTFIEISVPLSDALNKRRKHQDIPGR